MTGDAMPGAVQLALTAGPLAGYFLVLGLWRGGRSPRVIPGPLDFGLLAFALGGLIAFGPIGNLLVHRLFPGPSVWAWLTIATAWGLIALIWAPRSARRLVVYNVEPAALRAALVDVLVAAPGEFTATLRGFEDPGQGRGLAVHVAPGGRTVTVEAYGHRPEALIAAIEPALRARLREGSRPRSRPWAAAPWFALAAVTMIAPLLAEALRRPHLRAAWRALLHRLRGG